MRQILGLTVQVIDLSGGDWKKTATNLGKLVVGRLWGGHGADRRPVVNLARGGHALD